jgi:ketosteroid isomerase-like protein
MSAEDLESIRNAVALYVHVVDRKDWARLGEVYTPDAVYDGTSYGGARHDGLPAILAHLAKPTQPPMHTSSDFHIELDEGGLTGRGRGKFVVIRADMSVIAGGYEDVYVKTDAGWRIQYRSSFVTLGA